MKQGSPQVFVAIHLGARGHEHILGETDAPQATMGALHPLDGAFRALGHDDHEVHIAVVRGRAPSVRAEQPDLFRLKFRFKSFDRFLQKAGLNCLHGMETSVMATDLKARVWTPSIQSR